MDLDILGWIERAKNDKANAIYFQNNSPVRAKRGKGQIYNLTNTNERFGQTVSPKKNDILNLAKGLVSQDQWNQLGTEGFVRGTHSFGILSVKFSILNRENDVTLSIRWRTSQLEELSRWDLSSKVMSTLVGDGVILVAGPAHSGKSSFVSQLSRELSKDKKILTGIFASNPEEFENVENRSRFYFSALKKMREVALDFDIVVIDSDETEAGPIALSLAEAGKKVILVQTGRDLLTGVNCFVDSVKSQISARRAAEVLVAAFGVRLVEGTEQSTQPVFEFLLFSREYKKMIHEGDWESLAKTLTTMADKNGVQTFNHSLLSGLLKRKIDLKVGFENSHDPDGLNEMLKRIGI